MRLDSKLRGRQRQDLVERLLSEAVTVARFNHEAWTAARVPWGMVHSVVTHEPSLHLSFGFTPPLSAPPGGGRIPDYEFDLPAELQ